MVAEKTEAETRGIAGACAMLAREAAGASVVLTGAPLMWALDVFDTTRGYALPMTLGMGGSVIGWIRRDGISTSAGMDVFSMVCS